MDDQNPITEEQRRAVAQALLAAAQAVLGGDHPRPVLQALMGNLRGIATSSPVAAPGEQVALRPDMVTPAPAVAASRAANAELRATVVRIFDHWRRACDHPAAKLTADRGNKVVARLREGYSEQDVIAAIDGCAGSAFHRGENDSGTKYDDLTLICRTGSQLEKFRDMAPSVTPVVQAPTESPDQQRERREIERLEYEAKQLLKQGNVEAYNAAIRSVRERKAAARERS